MLFTVPLFRRWSARCTSTFDAHDGPAINAGVPMLDTISITSEIANGCSACARGHTSVKQGRKISMPL
jgi:hypothetical protein